MSELEAETDSGWGPLDGLPGNPMMWILILGELTVFGILLTGFSVARALDPSGFSAAQADLHPTLGGINTAVLVASGWLAALAQERVRRRGSGRGLLFGAMALGAVFIAIKVTEYAGLAALGHGMDGEGFFTLYFLITGFHALHVVLGVVILGIVSVWHSEDTVETGTAFWHMVDLIWVLVFPIVYLLR